MYHTTQRHVPEDFNIRALEAELVHHVTPSLTINTSKTVQAVNVGTTKLLRHDYTWAGYSITAHEYSGTYVAYVITA